MFSRMYQLTSSHFCSKSFVFITVGKLNSISVQGMRSNCVAMEPQLSPVFTLYGTSNPLGTKFFASGDAGRLSATIADTPGAAARAGSSREAPSGSTSLDEDRLTITRSLRPSWG